MTAKNWAVIAILGVALLSCSRSHAAEGSSSSNVPVRSEIPAEYKWRLSDIYATEELWQADFDKVKAEMESITKYQGRLTASARDLFDCLKLSDDISSKADKLMVFAKMHLDEDAANSRYQALFSRAESLASESSAAMSFISPELLTMSEATWVSFRSQEPALNVYNFYVEDLFRSRKHVLSPAEEKILSGVSELAGAPENIFNYLASVDMKFPKIQDEKGRWVQLSEGRYSQFITSENRRVRQVAYEKLLESYAQYRNTMAGTFGSNVKANQFFAKTRNYESSLEAALEVDNVPVKVYDNLIDAVSENLAPLHRYVKLKKKWLGLQEIHPYDMYAPLSQGKQMKLDYQQAKDLVRSGLAPLGEEYVNLVSQAYTSGWIDVFENQGKHSGAYSWGTYGVHPYILLNFNGQLDDAMTLAHEMGHAMHTYYSDANQPYATSRYTIFCAEVASTTNETLLMDYLLKTTQDKQQRIHLLSEYLNTIRSTVYTQTMYAEFEKIAHAKAAAGEAITPDLLDSIWRGLNEKYLGPEMVIDKVSDGGWARIPHFYADFYVYKYVTGFSAANALATGILAEGEPARTRYLNFLKSGGSDYSIALLTRAGVDLSTPKPIEITLQRFDKLLDEIEALLR